jgi:hypothetical protein
MPAYKEELILAIYRYFGNKNFRYRDIKDFASFHNRELMGLTARGYAEVVGNFIYPSGKWFDHVHVYRLTNKGIRAGERLAERYDVL